MGVFVSCTMIPMAGSLRELHGVRVYLCPVDGKELRSDRDAVDIMSDASEHRPDLIAVPIERLGDDFFNLRTRIAGEFLQRFVTYGKRVVIVGDISSRIADSASLRAFVLESNRGQNIWFAPSMDELADRLGHLASSGSH